jgi:hypothetical protein
VNNAGRGITRSVEEMTDDDFDDMMLVNTKSALYGMQTAVRHFKALATDAAPARGHVINVSSLLGRLPFASVRAAYCAVLCLDASELFLCDISIVSSLIFFAPSVLLVLTLAANQIFHRSPPPLLLLPVQTRAEFTHVLDARRHAKPRACGHPRVACVAGPRGH